MIQAIDRAARVLAALQGSRHLGITELGAILELPPSTVHGIVKSLLEHGLVVKEPHGQRYMLGPTLLQLSNVYLDTLDVRARAMRWTGDLSERTGLAVRLGVEFFDEVIVIHHEPRPDGTRQMPETGLTIPAHASALGKVLLAYRPAYLQSLLAKGPLRSLTGETIVDPDALEKALVEVRGEGVRRRGRGGRPRRGVDRRTGGRPRRRGGRRDRGRAARQRAAGRRLGAHPAARGRPQRLARARLADVAAGRGSGSTGRTRPDPRNVVRAAAAAAPARTR